MLNYSLEKYTPPTYKEIVTAQDGTHLPINVYAPTVKNSFNQTAVVCIHGGAWTSNLKIAEEWQGNWMRHNASLLAAQGYYALEITHRSITDTTLSNLLSDVETAFETAKNVIMPRHELKKLYAVGDSAGGHLALMSAIFNDTALRPEKAVACNPVSDLTDAKWQLGDATYEERKCASPLYRNDKTDTEIFIIHGEKDQTVPIEFSHKLHEHLLTLGNNSKLETLPEATHAFILYGYLTQIEKVNEYMEKVLAYLA